MALIVKSYGNGSLGDVTGITATVNSYVAANAITENSITIDATTKLTGTADFTVGAKILIHVSATTGTTTARKTYLGNWLVATVTAVNGNTSRSTKTRPKSSRRIRSRNITCKRLPSPTIRLAAAIADIRVSTNLTVSARRRLPPPSFPLSDFFLVWLRIIYC